jgi:hypothetical protein
MTDLSTDGYGSFCRNPERLILHLCNSEELQTYGVLLVHNGIVSTVEVGRADDVASPALGELF